LNSTEQYRFCFIMGVARCGTASLFNYLSQHSELKPSIMKEPVFFQLEANKGLNYYINTYFADADPTSLLLEAAHRNLFLPHAQRAIRDIAPHAKLIILLRNPVQRAHSHYWYYFSRGVEKLSFKDAIVHDLNRIQNGAFFKDQSHMREYLRELGLPENQAYFRTYVDSGFYADQISALLELFPRNQILFLKSEDFFKNPLGQLDGVCDFLGICKKVSFRAPHTKNPSRSLWAQKTIRAFTKLPLRQYVPMPVKKLVIPAVEWLSPTPPKLAIPPADEDILRVLEKLYREKNVGLDAMTGLSTAEWYS